MSEARTLGSLNTLHAKALPQPFACGVVGYTEVDNYRLRLRRWLRAQAATGWAMRRAGELAMTWDPDRFELVDWGFEVVTKGLAKVTPNRLILWVVLRERATDERRRYAVTHTVSGVRGRGKPPVAWRRRRWAAHLERLRELVQQWAAGGELVVVLGDFNDSPGAVHLPATLVGHSLGNGGIDQVWACGLTVEHFDRTPPAEVGSDHPLLRAVLTSATPPPRPPEDPVLTKLPTNLPDLLRAEGLDVEVLKGWQDRGRPPSKGAFRPVGVLWHHTGSQPGGDERAYARWMALQGRSDLPAPLCHLSIGRDGTVYVLAAGRANHAGKAHASGSVAAGDGNELYVGVECQNNGTEGWTPEQREAMVSTGVVLARVLAPNGSPAAQRGHKETSVTGKWDPGHFDMDAFRRAIGERLQRPRPAPGPAHTNVELAGLAVRAALRNGLQTIPPGRKRVRRGYAAMLAILDKLPQR